MLSGILTRDSGDCAILDMDPSKNRKKLSYDIGTVFGQKPQLWFHLPALDSFELFASIYGIPKKEFIKRRNKLVKLFEIEEIVKKPVRKLSLGERMRCEIVLALLHKPKILFLDEPTIGLDVVVKKTIRDLIKKINEKEGVTIILTSHDMMDIEQLCKRAIIINKGKITYDGDIEEIRKKYATKKIIAVSTKENIQIPSKYAVLEKSKYFAKISIDTKKTSLHSAIESITKQNKIEDITISDTPIEEIITNIFKGVS
jgi:ABC-2 type transport system ATP-binding protein